MKKTTAIAAVFVLLLSLTACKDKKSPASYPSFGITEHAEGSLPDFLPATGSDAPATPDAPAPTFTLPSGNSGKDEKTAPFMPSIPDGSDDFGDDFRYNIDPEDLEKFREMDAYKIRALAVRKSQLISDLFFAFAKAQLDIDIDETSGIVTLDETVLFSGDSAALSESGKEFLNKFIGAYASVLLKEKYDGFISKVLIEGHTARLENSTYESGLPLSTYCLHISNPYTDHHIRLQDMNNHICSPFRSDNRVTKSLHRLPSLCCRRAHKVSHRQVYFSEKLLVHLHCVNMYY